MPVTSEIILKININFVFLNRIFKISIYYFQKVYKKVELL